MRHLKRGRKLNRNSSHRKAMVRNLVSSLFEHGRVVTTPAKAKEARPFAEKLITMAKKGTLAHRRRAISVLNNRKVVKYLFDDLAKRYDARPGGYCRILHLDRYRLGDGGSLCLFELVEEEVKSKKKPTKRKKAAVVAPVEAPKAEEAAEEAAPAEAEEAAAEESSEEKAEG